MKKLVLQISTLYTSPLILLFSFSLYFTMNVRAQPLTSHILTKFHGFSRKYWINLAQICQNIHIIDKTDPFLKKKPKHQTKRNPKKTPNNKNPTLGFKEVQAYLIHTGNLFLKPR